MKSKTCIIEEYFASPIYKRPRAEFSVLNLCYFIPIYNEDISFDSNYVTLTLLCNTRLLNYITDVLKFSY